MKSQSHVVRVKNVQIIRSHKILKQELWIQDGKIVDPEVLFWQKRSADVTLDGKGLLLAPGYIDLQINGAFGYDFSSPSDLTDRDGLAAVARGLLATGTTAFCPTVITSQPQTYAQTLPRLPPTPGTPDRAHALGAHVEGPYLSEQKYGAHNKDFVKSSCGGIGDVKATYGSLDNVRIITVAPEIPGMLATIPPMTKRGIVVSAGHSMASVDQGQQCVAAGVRLVTHLFNAMVPFHHRDPGLVGLLGMRGANKPFFSIIVDGIHAHPASVNIAHKSHPEGLVLVTDAIEAMGLGVGSYELGTQKVTIRDDGAYITGTDILAGSIARMDQCVRNFRKFTDCSIVEAIEAATLHPAQALGIEANKGTLDFGSDADFIALDSSLQVHATFIEGNLAWRTRGSTVFSTSS